MKRSEINKALKRMESVIKDLKISLPPFCSFTPEEWSSGARPLAETWSLDSRFPRKNT